jgi:hypothetical protein
VTLFVDLLVIAGGVVLGRWVARSIRSRQAAPSPPGSDVEAEEDDGSPDPFRGFPCRVGDVILRTAEHDEAWLAGALVFREEAPVAALFVAPEAGSDRALFVRPDGDSALLWLTALPPGAITWGNEPPHAMEIGGARFERTRRLPVHVAREGAGAPDVGQQAVVFEYAAASERILVVAGAEKVLSWRGVRLAEGEFEVLPGS